MTKQSDPQTSETRRLAAILAADVVGYSAMMEVDERETLKRLRDLREGLLQPKVAEHHGRIFKTMGDGFLVEFSSVVDAVHCAVEIQKALAARNLDLPTQKRVQLRIGVNLGDVFHEGEDVFGDGVNVAARLEAMAPAGGICVSRAVREQIREKLNFDFADLGEHQVKNISRPIQIYSIAFEGAPENSVKLAKMKPAEAKTLRWMLAGAAIVVTLAIALLAWRAFQPRRPAPWSAEDPRMAFAVLPVEASPDAGGYANTLTDQLIAGLSIERHVSRVLSRDLVQGNLQGLSAREIGAKLNVAYVVRAKAARRGDILVTDISLASTQDGHDIFHASIKEPVDTPLDPEREALRSICGTIADKGFDTQITRAQQIPDARRDARDLVDVAWAVSSMATKNNVDQSVAFDERALQLMPDNSHVLADLGLMMAYRASNGWSNDRKADFQRALGYLDKAIAVDNEDLEALHGKELVFMGQRRWSDAVSMIDSILAIHPTSSSDVINKAISLVALNRPEEALDVLRRKAVRRDDSQNAFVLEAFARAYMSLGRFDEAADKFRAAIVLSPPEGIKEGRGASLVLHLASAEAMAGHADAAKRYLREFRDVYPDVATLESALNKIEIDFDSPELLQILKDGLRKAGLPS